jgi:oxygen-independent coproporphyrinogen-3 oxidase
MFGYPNQTIDDVKEDIQTALDLGVDQISTYPIFTFPHTKLEDRVIENHSKLPGILVRRKMFKEIENLCYDAGLKRTSVWAFTKENKPKYSSVTIPNYIGIGAGAGSLIPRSFYLNAFDIDYYINMLNEKMKPPVVLTIDFSEKEEMIHWLYWRIYETTIHKQEFIDLFQKEFDSVFGRLFSVFEIAGFCKDTGDTIIMTDRGNYWIHVLQNVFSLDFIGRVWNECLFNTNPTNIELI